jgi:hypothetical protein
MAADGAQNLCLDLRIGGGQQGGDGRDPAQISAQIIGMSRDPNSDLRSRPSLSSLVKAHTVDVGSDITQEVLRKKSPRETESQSSSQSKQPAGVGVVLSDKHAIKVVFPSGAAAASGMVEVGDVVLAVNGDPTSGRDAAEVQACLVGAEGTEVRESLYLLLFRLFLYCPCSVPTLFLAAYFSPLLVSCLVGTNGRATLNPKSGTPNPKP